MNIKRDKRDAIFSLLVRERANWRCERCGKQFERGAQNIHCSHFFGRRHRSTRWHPENAAAHCFACHQFLGEHPVEFTRWIENRIGQGRTDIIGRTSKVVAKFSKKDLESIYKHMKAEYAKMLNRRKEPNAASWMEFEDAPEIAALDYRAQIA